MLDSYEKFYSSEKVDLIISAIFAMQGEVLESYKNSVNPHFKSRYSDLVAVMEALREPMQKNGLCVVQTTFMENDRFFLKTKIFHISGQWISSDYPLKPLKDDPQSMGSAITYARRYSLAAMTGLVQVDDDGNEASKTKKERFKEDPKENKTPRMITRMITKEEYEEIKKCLGGDEKKEKALEEYVKGKGFDSIESISIELYELVIKHFKNSSGKK